MQTPIQLPAVLLELKASEEEVVEPASLLTCWTRVTPPVETGRLVSEKFAGVATPVTDADTLYGPPAVLLAVNVAAVATPCVFVVAVFIPPANVPLAPLAGAAKVTVAPLTGLFPESFTVAWSRVANAVPTVALCGVPAVTVMLAGAPARLVKEKLAGVAAPDTDAVTLYGPPAVPLAVKVVAVATPCAFVVAVFTPPANAPLAPLAGAIKVTVAPFTGLLPESFTVAWNGVANAVLIVALCGVPAVAAILVPVPPPVAGLNAARLAPQASGAPREAPAEIVPAVVCI